MGTGQIAESGQVDNYLGLVGKSGYDLGEIFLEDAKSWALNFTKVKPLLLKKRKTAGAFHLRTAKSLKLKQSFTEQVQNTVR